MPKDELAMGYRRFFATNDPAETVTGYVQPMGFPMALQGTKDVDLVMPIPIIHL